MKNIFYSKKFIPFRNFDKILSTFKFRIFYYNFFFRKIFQLILKFLNFLGKDNFIYHRIGHYLYFCESAKEVGICKLSNEKLFAVKLADNYRKIILTDTKKKISITIDKVNNTKLFFGIAILENQYFISKKFLNFDLNCQISLRCNQIKKKFNLQIPLNKKKHGIFSNITDGKFYDFYISLDNYLDKKLEIEINFFFNEKTFLALEDNFIKKRNQTYKTIALSMPFYNSRYKTKKVFLLSIESLTNFINLEKNLSKDIKIPFLKKLISKNKYSNNVYSAADWTMPNLYSLHSGLVPSQHGVCDPRAPIYQENVSDKIIMLAEIFKKNNFINTAFVNGPRFNISKNWTKGYDCIYKSFSTSDENAPNFEKLKKHVLAYKDVDLFVYMHFDILHSPFLHLKNSDLLENQNVEIINSAISKKDFYPLYIQQLEKIDRVLESFIEFLENNKLYEESLVIIYGDHGPSLPPKWIKYSGNSLYDEHLNVPLIVKEPSWVDRSLNLEYDRFYTSQVQIFKMLLEYLNEPNPKYFEFIPQYNSKFKDFAISETLHMPNNECYNFRLTSQKDNILARTKINWQAKKLIKFINEEELRKYNKFDICNEYLTQNLNFKKKYNNNFFGKKYFE